MASPWPGFGLALITCMASSLLAADDSCKPLSAATTSHITEYLAERIVSLSGGVPSILSAGPVSGTCYQKLVFHVSGTEKPLTLYLSPDQRFLTSTIYDLSVDPKAEEARTASDVERLLMRDESPRLSGANPQVVLVEFGDLQCPYCKRFADWYRSLPPALLDRTSLVFKHLPLVIHPWARLAASYAACANQQLPAAFWQLASYFVDHQDGITPDNIRDQVEVALSQTANIDASKLASCATSGAGPGLVARDVAVASELGVTRTPTLFIDGRRAPQLQSAEDLRLLLDRELQTRTIPAAVPGRQPDRGGDHE